MQVGAGAMLGRYQLLTEIGRGAMGTVFQALDPEIERLVAIKIFSVVDATGSEGEAFRARFAQEARVAGRLMDPSIVAVYDVGEEASSGTPYIVMEYVPGQPLSRLLSATATRLEERFALKLAEQVAEALGYAHEKRVVHRDIKPANILITEDGNPKITDFGVARLDLSNLTLRGESLGTPAYMAPEQLTGAPVDGRSDLFSLGVILYTMLIGFRPFQGNSAKTISFKVINQEPVPVTSFHLDLSKDTEYVVARAMAKSPAARYQTGWEFAADLSDILEGREPRTRRKHPIPVSAEVFRVAEGFRTLAAIRGPITPLKEVPAVPETLNFPASPTVTSAPPISSSRTPWRGNGILTALVLTGIALAGVSGGVLITRIQRNALRAADREIGMPAYLGEALPRPEEMQRPSSHTMATAVTSALSKPTAARSGEAPDLDYTVIRSRQAAPSGHNAKLVDTAVVAPLTPATVRSIPRQAILRVFVHHHFKEAELSVWVDGKLAYSGSVYGESKKHLFVLREVNATDSREIRLSEGVHDFKVRLASAGSHFDASETLHANLPSAKNPVLEINCGKQGIKLKLADAS